MTPLLFAVAGTFVLVLSATAWFVSRWLTAHSPEQQRLHALLQGPGVTTVPLDQSVAGHLDPLLARLSRVLPRRSATQLSSLQLRLSHGGFDGPHAASYFALAEIAVPAAAAVMALAIGGMANWLYAVPAAVVGVALPHLWLDRRVLLYQRAIRNGLPDALDLLTLCVEAGTGLDQAVAKTSEELQIVHPSLSNELRLMTTEIRAGRPRLEAFSNFATRTGVEEVRALTGMLRQTDRFGTSIGQALRTHAQTTRTMRRQRAQERAGRVGVKLVFPLALCLFPALYVVTFGPVAVKIFRALF
jgi:tight adherence protein C